MKDDLSTQIAQSIIDLRAHGESLGELAEFGIDQLLDDGLLKEVPWVGWIYKAKEVYSSVSDRILFAKIAKFLFCLARLEDEFREGFRQNLVASQAERKKVGQSILLILDRVDDLQKPDLLARCFSYFLSGHLSFREFLQLGDAITKCHSIDLEWFSTPFPRINILPPYQRLFSAGLAQLQPSVCVAAREDPQDCPLTFEMSDCGELLQDVISGRLPRRPDAAKRVKRNLAEQHKD